VRFSWSSVHVEAVGGTTEDTAPERLGLHSMCVTHTTTANMTSFNDPRPVFTRHRRATAESETFSINETAERCWIIKERQKDCLWRELLALELYGYPG
jgi:hypothetical protein